MKCPICEGKGRHVEFVLNGQAAYSDCGFCKGTGNVTIIQEMRRRFWENMPIGLVEWYGEKLARREDDGLS